MGIPKGRHDAEPCLLHRYPFTCTSTSTSIPQLSSDYIISFTEPPFLFSITHRLPEPENQIRHLLYDLCCCAFSPFQAARLEGGAHQGRQWRQCMLPSKTCHLRSRLEVTEGCLNDSMMEDSVRELGICKKIGDPESNTKCLMRWCCIRSVAMFVCLLV